MSRRGNKHTSNRVLSQQGLWIGLAVLSLAIVIAIGAIQGKIQVTEITVYKSPTCGCCQKWIDHLEDNGFLVDVENRSDLNPIKDAHGIVPKLQSCHTALVEGYVVEGHVPAADIQRMLAERPAIKGIAVPGMPVGSPGMEGRFSDPYDVLALKQDGATSTFARH